MELTPVHAMQALLLLLLAWPNKESAVPLAWLAGVGEEWRGERERERERNGGGREGDCLLSPHARPLSGCFLCLTAPLAELALSLSFSPATVAYGTTHYTTILYPLLEHTTYS